MKTLYICIHTHTDIYISHTYVCVCVWNMPKSIQRWCILIPIRILNNVRHGTNPSTIQSRASPRVYMRGCNSSVTVRTTHKPERLAQCRARVTAWMIIELGFDCTAEHRFCVRDFVQISFRPQTPPLQIGPSWVGSYTRFHLKTRNRYRFPNIVFHSQCETVVRDLRLSTARVTCNGQDPLEINCHSYPSSTEDEKAWRFATMTQICLYDVALRLPCFIGIIALRITDGQSLASGRDMANGTQRQFDNAE